MIRLYVVVEGATEEGFARAVLYPHLLDRGVCLCTPRIGKPGHKGGRVNYARAKKDILLLLKQDRNAYCTTLFDFYGLGEGFPRRAVPVNASVDQKAKSVEDPFHKDITTEMGHMFDVRRFIPYLQMHEFEGLLFSDVTVLAAKVGRPDLLTGLEAVRGEFRNPEEIDDGPTSAPSKRIQSLVPNYDKVFHGSLAARGIGLTRMRQECPRFSAWISRLEALA
jgi:hypothetical protein